MNFEEWQKRIAKHTKWKCPTLFTIGGLNIIDTQCSLCGHMSYLVLPKGSYCVYDYCPFCGTKMTK